MKAMKLNYNIINQIKEYFKFLESAPNLTFGKRRVLSRINEELEKEFKAFIDEVNKIADEYCEKDENGDFIRFEDGSQKIKEEFIKNATDRLNEVYKTEVEIEAGLFKIDATYFDQLKCDKETFEFIENNFIE